MLKNINLKLIKFKLSYHYNYLPMQFYKDVNACLCYF